MRATANSKAQVGILLFNESFMAVLMEYSNYNNVFSTKNIVELLKHMRIYDYVIELEENKQSSFRPIDSLDPMELITLKTYIKTNLANSFMQLSKSSAGILILFD